MRDWHADDFAFLAAVVFSLSSFVVALTAIAIAIALGPVGVIGLIAAICAYGVLTELHVRRRMQAGLSDPILATSVPRFRLGSFPRQGRIHFSFSAHLEWSSQREDERPAASSHPQLTGGLAMDLDWATDDPSPGKSGNMQARVEAAQPGYLSGQVTSTKRDEHPHLGPGEAKRSSDSFSRPVE